MNEQIEQLAANENTRLSSIKKQRNLRKNVEKFLTKEFILSI